MFSLTLDNLVWLQDLKSSPANLACLSKFKISGESKHEAAACKVWIFI